VTGIVFGGEQERMKMEGVVLGRWRGGEKKEGLVMWRRERNGVKSVVVVDVTEAIAAERERERDCVLR